MTASHPTPYSLAILAGLQRKTPLFQGAKRPVVTSSAKRKRLAHRAAVTARAATVARQKAAALLGVTL